MGRHNDAKGVGCASLPDSADELQIGFIEKMVRAGSGA